jgi:hypothetical protein
LQRHIQEITKTKQEAGSEPWIGRLDKPQCAAKKNNGKNDEIVFCFFKKGTEEY